MRRVGAFRQLEAQMCEVMAWQQTARRDTTSAPGAAANPRTREFHVAKHRHTFCLDAHTRPSGQQVARPCFFFTCAALGIRIIGGRSGFSGRKAGRIPPLKHDTSSTEAATSSSALWCQHLGRSWMICVIEGNLWSSLSLRDEGTGLTRKA